MSDQIQADTQPVETVTDNRADRILAWAREHGNEFKASEAADFLDVNTSSIGATLTAMVNAGKLTSYQRSYQRGEKRSKRKVYAIPTPLPDDIRKLLKPEFVPGLKDDLLKRLNKLDAEANRIRNALTVLK